MVISTTVAGILAASGTSIIAGSNLINGWRQRKFQENEGDRQRTFSAELQERQMQFQAALQEKNLRRAEILQREIVMLQYSTALALQKSSFDNQLALWEHTSFYNNQWPLRATPKQYVHDLVRTYNENKVPLQILVPELLSERIVELGDVMKSSYSMHSGSPVFYYTGGWKNVQTIKGTALLSTLHSVLKGLPTLVLIPSGSFRDKVKIELGYWGMGGLCDFPELKEIATIDMHKLDFDLIRSHTDDLIALYHDESEKLAGNVNVDVRRQELARRAELISKGCADEEIERKLWQEFSDKYQRKNIEWELEDAKQKILGKILDVVCAGYTDIYHMLEFNTMPQAPLIAKDNNLIADAEVRSILIALYGNTIETLRGDERTHLLRYPLCSALVAKSFYEAGWIDDAKIFGQKSEAALLNIYDIRREDVMPSHCKAMKVLMECGIANDNSRISYIADDKYLLTKEVPVSSESANAKIARANLKIKSKKYSDAISILEELNDHCEALATLGLLRLKGLGCPKDISGGVKLLSKAAELGSCRACCNLYFELRDSNKARALQFLEMAASRDDWDALYILADEYRQIGQFSKMEKLYVRGAQLGDQRAVKQLRKITKG